MILASEPRMMGTFIVFCNRSVCFLSCFQRSFGHPRAHLTATSVLYPQRTAFLSCTSSWEWLYHSPAPPGRNLSPCRLPSLAKSVFFPQYPLKTISSLSALWLRVPVCLPWGTRKFSGSALSLQIYFSRGHLSMPKT